MKKFILHISIFIFPLFLSLGIMLIIIFRSGEFFNPLNELILSNQDYLIGKHHTKHIYALKWRELTLNQKREILVLGTSRVMAFRQEMFKKAFYNAGYTISNISDYRQFLLNIPKEKLPPTIIIGLDQRMFRSNDSYSKPLKTSRKKDYWNKYQIFPDLNYLKSFFYKIIYFEYDLNIILDHLLRENNGNKIGFDAILNNTGFRKDGSYNFHKEVNRAQTVDSNFIEKKFSKNINHIKNGTHIFGFAKNVNQNAIFELKKLIQYCDINNIYVIAIINPYPSTIKKMINNNYNFLYMDKIVPEVKNIITYENYEIWDLNQLSYMNMNDDEFIDGIHGIEVTAIKILLSIAKEKSRITGLVDTKKLNNDLEERKNNYLVY